MKKFFIYFLSLVLPFCLSGCHLGEISLLYSDDGEIDGFFIAINKPAYCCFVGEYNCTEYVENQEITIPDEYENIPVTRLGGYRGTGLPTPFMISLANLYMNAPEDSEYNGIYCGDIEDYNISDTYSVEYLTFNLNIGKNIEVIENVEMDVYFPHINEDNSITFYRPIVHINCSEENKHFYSKDGKLYNKKTNELISVFVYEPS